MKPLAAALQLSPIWCEVLRADEQQADLRITLDEAPAFDGIVLNLSENSKLGLSVKEKHLGDKLPAFCPERHINDDGSFCIKLGSDRHFNTAQEYSEWWYALGEYFKGQYYAEETGFWPLTMGLSHGDAVKEQLQIERLLADHPRLRTEALQGMFRRKGWLGWTLPRLSNKQQLFDPGGPCPRGCKGACKLNAVETVEIANRADCNNKKSVAIRDCKNARLLAKIVAKEGKRRGRERKLIKQIIDVKSKRRQRKLSKHCCGSMKICPLRDWNRWR